MKRAALYIRVSTEEQAKYGFSLAEQQHDLECYAARHSYTVIGVYADEGNTARKALSLRTNPTKLATASNTSIKANTAAGKKSLAGYATLSPRKSISRVRRTARYRACMAHPAQQDI